MTSDVHARFDLLTPKELRGHILRDGRVGITDEHGHPKIIFFRAKGLLLDIFPKIFFRCSETNMGIKRPHFGR